MAKEGVIRSTKEYKVVIGFENGAMGQCGAVEYLGAIWLVPKWLTFPNERYAKPERMIRLDQFRFQEFDPPATIPTLFAGANFAVNDVLPRALFDGKISQQIREKYVILEKPDAKFIVGVICPL